MHNDSLPPGDRSEIPVPITADPNLLAEIKALGLSNSQIASGVGMSAPTISNYLNRKEKGDIASLEIKLREWLRDRTITSVTGVATIETKLSDKIASRLESVRTERELALFIGPAGIGKSRGIGLYLIDHTLAIPFRVRPWHAGMNGLAADLAPAAGIIRFAKGEKKWETICDKTKDSGRLLIVDDAQELSHRGLQCCVDWHEQTGNPVALFGHKALFEKLQRDSRRARRVGAVVNLTTDDKPLGDDPDKLINHLIDQLAPSANGNGHSGSERDDLFKLCRLVALQPGGGCFGAVEKQLKSAARALKKKAGVSPTFGWVTAFRAAHLKLVRGYTLPPLLNPVS